MLQAKVTKSAKDIRIYIRNCAVDPAWGLSTIFYIENERITENFFYAIQELTALGYEISYHTQGDSL